MGLVHTPPRPATPVLGQTHGMTFAAAGSAAAKTLLDVYYGGDGLWRACDSIGCPSGNVDWGYDTLTYTLSLLEQATKDKSLLPVLSALTASARSYPGPCDRAARCPAWSDTPEWDAIALLDEYGATHDPTALTKAEAAYAYVAGSKVFDLGACPSIPYQEPDGGGTHVKTLETVASAIKAALLLYHATAQSTYLTAAEQMYAGARRYFLDPRVPLYTVYVFDSGRSCTQLPHRFFASVNGDMIWSGAVLYRDTGQEGYLQQATATAEAVQRELSDPRGIFTDLQAENDVVEPLVEGMAAMAAQGDVEADSWVLTNASAALGARTPDGSFGRFFDGPPPATTVTAWQTNGGLALEIVAATIAGGRTARPGAAWDHGSLVVHATSQLPVALRFHGSGIAVFGTLGYAGGGLGHAQVLVDGRETFDHSGIWQNKSSSLLKIPRTVLFAWRWPAAGTHTLRFLPGAENAKEGGGFLRLAGYEVLR